MVDWKQSVKVTLQNSALGYHEKVAPAPLRCSGQVMTAWESGDGGCVALFREVHPRDKNAERCSC